MILEVNIDRTTPATPIVKLSGRMTLGMRLREVESRIDEVAADPARKLILDLSAVEYSDSSGLGLIMILYGKMKSAGGQLRIVAPNEFVLDLFKKTCIDTILTVDPDLATALAA
jgi:anti-sigma B factor antagonist